MALWKASTTKSEWCPDDPMAFAPTKPWKLPFITTWGGSPNRNLPTNSAEEANVVPGRILSSSAWQWIVHGLAPCRHFQFPTKHDRIAIEFVRATHTLPS